jgi:hypothetical protein
MAPSAPCDGPKFFNFFFRAFDRLTEKKATCIEKLCPCATGVGRAPSGSAACFSPIVAQESKT